MTMSRSGLTAEIAECRVRLEHGDITKLGTTSIVNSVCGGPNLGGMSVCVYLSC